VNSGTGKKKKLKIRENKIVEEKEETDQIVRHFRVYSFHEMRRMSHVMSFISPVAR
jgi:hypothetical protein